MTEVSQGFDLGEKEIFSSVLEIADVYDHIDLGSTALDGILRLCKLCRSRHGTEREPDDTSDGYIRIFQKAGTELHVASVHAYGSEAVFSRLCAELLDLFLAGICFEERMIEVFVKVHIDITSVKHYNRHCSDTKHAGCDIMNTY